MNPTIKAAWIAALRSGEYQQAHYECLMYVCYTPPHLQRGKSKQSEDCNQAARDNLEANRHWTKNNPW